MKTTNRGQTSQTAGKAGLPGIDLEKFLSTLASAWELAIHHYRTHSDDQGFERAEGELNGIFSGLLALARTTHPNSP